jgi:hypothetical protein
MSALNTAEKVWKVIENNHATVNAHTSHASALPAGADLQKLTGEQGVSSLSWRWDSGLVLKDFTLDITVTWYHSARYNGGGAWIPRAVVNLHIDMGWLGGYTVDVIVTAGDPWTEGDEQRPVAVLPMSVEMRWSNWLFTNVTSAELTLKGNGGTHWHVEDTYSVSYG